MTSNSEIYSDFNNLFPFKFVLSCVEKSKAHSKV